VSGKGLIIIDDYLPFETWQHIERWYVAREINGVIVFLDREDAVPKFERDTAMIEAAMNSVFEQVKPKLLKPDRSRMMDKAWFRRFEKRRDDKTYP
jgi:hypothetical protein